MPLQPIVVPIMQVEPQLWNALAGPAAAARVPAQGSYVFFFSEGHPGQSLPEEICLSDAFLCRVSSIYLLADHNTDEVFARISLYPHPVTDPNRLPHAWMPVACSSSTSDIVDVVSFGEFTSFAKFLTKTDVGKVLTVPKSCALAVFPPVRFNMNNVVLTEDMSALDVHGRSWNFRLILCGHPQCYNLYKWLEFTTMKRLVEDDIVVFAKHRAGDLYIGIRRTGNSSDATKKASMQADLIAKATQLARAGLPFEVAYYPGDGSPEHVVAAVPVPHQVEGAAEAAPSRSKGKRVQKVPRVQSLGSIERSRDKAGEDDDNNEEGGSSQSLGASTRRSFKLFGYDI